MPEKGEANRIVFRAIDAASELSLAGNLSKDPDSVLLGEGCQLSSMDFVNLVVALEEEVETATGRTIGIAERLSADTSGRALWTVGQLIEMVDELLTAATTGSTGGTGAA